MANACKFLNKHYLYWCDWRVASLFRRIWAYMAIIDLDQTWKCFVKSLSFI